jgi:CubicO group peptidase (beta-lactamase class C family)
MRTAVWILAATLVPAAPVTGSPFSDLRKQIITEVEYGNVSAFAVAVLRGGRIVWEEGFGSVDGEPVTANTPFSLASVSKPVTATALMILAQRGELDLDRPIDEYLRDAHLTARGGSPAGATVRRVASHTAGLPLHFRFFTPEEGEASFEEMVARYALIVHPPGSTYQYSNLGYRLLERALETVTGEPLSVVLRREIFEPLGMESAVLPARSGEGLPALIPRTHVGGQPLPFYRSDHPGGSDMYASAHDLARFAAFHLGTRFPGQVEILDRRNRDEMRRPLTPRNSGERHAYGIGWLVENESTPTRTVIGHTGGMPGARAALYLMPSRKLAVITLSSSETNLTEHIARQILARHPAPHGTTLSRLSQIQTPPLRRRPPRGMSGEWAGSVTVDGVPLPLSLTVERNGVRVRMGEQEERRAIAPRYDRGVLKFWIDGLELPSPDLTPDHYRLQFTLELRDGRLRGTATAYGRTASSLPFALAHWVELEH